MTTPTSTSLHEIKDMLTNKKSSRIEPAPTHSAPAQDLEAQVYQPPFRSPYMYHDRLVTRVNIRHPDTPAMVKVVHFYDRYRQDLLPHHEVVITPDPFAYLVNHQERVVEQSTDSSCMSTSNLAFPFR